MRLNSRSNSFYFSRYRAIVQLSVHLEFEPGVCACCSVEADCSVETLVCLWFYSIKIKIKN